MKNEANFDLILQTKQHFNYPFVLYFCCANN